MISPKKPNKEMNDLEKWELLKSNGILIESILLHQPGPVFTSTDRTIHASKPKFKSIKMWRTPTCYLLELGNKREIIEVTSVFSSKPV